MQAMIFKYLIVLIFFIVYASCDATAWGYVVDGAFINHLRFCFAHVSLLHLLINSLVFINMFDIVRLRLRVRSLELFVNIYLVSFIASIFTAASVPTVGASGMIYALFGLHIASMEKLNKPNVIFIVSIATMLAISLIKTNSNFGIHILSLLFSMIAWLIYRALEKVTSRSSSV